jgi:hypothetical protein
LFNRLGAKPWRSGLNVKGRSMTEAGQAYQLTLLVKALLLTLVVHPIRPGYIPLAIFSFV